MGNLCSTPQGSRFDIPVSRADGDLVREALRKVTAEAEMNIRLGQQTYDRRKARGETNHRHNDSRRNRHRGPRGNDPDEAYDPALGFVPPDLNAHETYPHISPHYQAPQGNPRGPPAGVYRGYGNSRTARDGGELDDEDLEDDEYDDRSPSGRQYRDFGSPSGLRTPTRERPHQSPRARRQHPQQVSAPTYMSGAIPGNSPQQEERPSAQ
ncbi:MAG: hypothetical protein Q9219_001163 [cf. Caloplaca sp. 3 TL-2023]